MNRKMSKRQRDIKSKLMAAICMLLVSSIMMVSTTYAWFTLSTAPEVTGISTQVGANGNLEMALLPEDIVLTALDDPQNGIKSNEGDSYAKTKSHKVSNITWGNLVDVSDPTYGMGQIKLYPAALNLGTKDATGKYQNEDANGNPTKVDATVLKTPTYGADGRVIELMANALPGVYNTDEAGFFPDAAKYGVRAVGVTSGMTPRQLAYRNAQSSASSYMGSAKNQASDSLSKNGSSLADIAIKRGLNKDATYTQEELGKLLAIVNDLAKSGGILDSIEKAYKQYILAYASSTESGLEDATWQVVNSAVEGSSLNDLLSYITAAANEEIAGIAENAAALEATRGKVNGAKTKLEALQGNNDQIAWDALSAAMGDLVSTDALLVNGLTVGDIKVDPNILVQKFMEEKELVVSIAENGGVYADVAKHCGNFNSGITIKEVKYGTLDLKDIPAKMQTVVAAPFYLEAVGTAIKTETTAPATAEGTAKPMTDMYGYIIDLAFRTNAANSDLLLQSDAVDRIYDSNKVGAQIEGDETTTMGGGTYMTLASSTPNFSNENVKELMKGIRIVFFTPVDGAVVATAKLDAANAETTAEGMKAKLYTYTLGAGGAEEKSTDNKIMELTQNQAVALSVLVYLDGNYVTNEHVATEATSVTGMMNLQFSSSAELTPMDYTPLKNTGVAAPDNGGAEQQNVEEQQNGEEQQNAEGNS